MPQDTDLVVSLCATRDDLHTQVHLNMLATQIARLAREQGVFAGVTILPMAGKFSTESAAEITGALHGELARGELDAELPPEGPTEPMRPPPPQTQPPANGEPPAEQQPDDVLTRLAKRGVQITYRMIGQRKVTCLNGQLPDVVIDTVKRFFSRYTRPLRVIVLDGWSGEVAASILAAAPDGTSVYSSSPADTSRDGWDDILDEDLHELQAQLGVRPLDHWPTDPAGVDAIVICDGKCYATRDTAGGLLQHLDERGVFLGIGGAERLRELGVHVDKATQIWAISAKKVRDYLAHEEAAAGV